MQKRLKETTTPRVVLVTCGTCLQDYEPGKAHACSGVRPPADAHTLVL